MIKRVSVFAFFICFHIIRQLIAHSVIFQDSTRAETMVSLSTIVDTKRIPLNRTLLLTVQMKWMGDLDLIEIDELEEPIISNFEIIGSSSANRVSGIPNGKKSIKEVSYTLQPTTLGMGYIESVVLSYRDLSTGKTHHLKTQRIGAEVVSSVPDEGQTGKIRLYIFMGVLIIIGFSILFFIMKRRAGKDEEEEEIERIIEQTYLEMLKETVDLKSADRREAFTILSKLFRRYLSEKYEISTMEATTEELLNSLTQEGLDERLIGRCEILFTKADVVKFSGQDAEQSELEEAYTTVETILESHLSKIEAKLMAEEDKGKQKKRKKKQ